MRDTHSELMKNLGSRVQILREAAGLTRAELGFRMGCPTGGQLLLHWETGKSLPNVKWLPPLARALRVSLDYLVTGREYHAPILDNTENVGTTTS